MNYKVKWDLGLLYKSEHDPEMECDILAIEKACSDFEKTYRNKAYIETPQKLAKALKQYESLNEAWLSKPLLYFYLKKDIESDNTNLQARATLVEHRIATASNKATFFTLEIAKIPLVAQKRYLAEAVLQPYVHFLKNIFLNASYQLSEKEEQLNNLLNQTSEAMWLDVQKKMLGKQTVRYKKKRIPLSEARDMLVNLPKKERHLMAHEMTMVSKSISFLAEAELNAICNYKKVIDEKRGYKTPYSASVIGNENTEDEIKEFSELVTDHFGLSRRFYKLHAKLLGEKKITLADRRVMIGAIKKKFDFKTGASVAKDALTTADPKYGALLESYLQKGQIDVYPRSGKSSGGYCMSVGDLPTYILLNQVDNVQSIETLAHEMGHAIHAELDNHLSPLYQGHSLATAEVASMFFEQFVGLELQKYLSDEEKFIHLHRSLSEDIHAIFCQIACFNFELELHTRIRTEGQVSKEVMAQLMQKHLQAYCGDAFTITEDDGYSFVTWPHIRYFFYTYTYAYGGLVSRVLFENWKQDHAYIHKVEQFLSAGRSMNPKDIFKSIGITTNKAFFEAGLKGIEADIIKLEKLAKKMKKI